MKRPPLAVAGSTALVTGAAGGMGEHLARGLARRGAHLVLLDRDAAGLAAVAATIASETPGVEVATYEVDLSDRQSSDDVIARVVQAHPGISIVLNNAGVALGGRFTQVSVEDFDWLMEINLHAPIRVTRALLPVLLENGQGQVVNTSSLFGLVGPPGQSAYCTAKYGLRGFSEALRNELEESGDAVGVTTVHPGGIRTNIAKNARMSIGLDEKQASKQQKSFAALLTYPADKAAEEIIEALIARQRRLLIGNDARFLDVLARLFPSTYWPVSQRVLREVTKRKRRR